MPRPQIALTLDGGPSDATVRVLARAKDGRIVIVHGRAAFLSEHAGGLL